MNKIAFGLVLQTVVFAYVGCSNLKEQFELMQKLAQAEITDQEFKKECESKIAKSTVNWYEAKQKYILLKILVNEKLYQLIKNDWEMRKMGQDAYVPSEEYAAHDIYALVADPSCPVDMRGGRIFFFNMEDNDPLSSYQYESIKIGLSKKIYGKTIPELAEAKAREVCAEEPQCKMCKDAQATWKSVQELVKEVEQKTK